MTASDRYSALRDRGSAQREAALTATQIRGEFGSRDGDDLRSEHERLRHALEQERRARISLERRVAREVALTEQRIKGHLSYRLGSEIVASRRSPLSWLSLPVRLLRAYRNFRAVGNANRQDEPSGLHILELYQRQGVEGVGQWVKSSVKDGSPAKTAKSLIHAGRVLAEAGNQSAELILTSEACRIDSSTPTLRARFWACHRAADHAGAVEAAEQLWTIAEEHDFHPDEQARLDKIFQHPIRLLATLNLIREPSAPLIQSSSGRLCYVLHNSLPYSSGGYATRSHGLAKALVSDGLDVVALTRPGFPIDVNTALTQADVGAEEQIDGVRYIRSLEPTRTGLGTTQYIELAASVVESLLYQHRPEVVVAASNHLTALPALIASRRLGIPFFYEVRGFWEITRASREPDFINHINFWIQSSLEAAVAKKSDGVFTLTMAMREELVDRGVPPDKITLLPNSCDTEQFKPTPRQHDLQDALNIPHGVPVIGYIGSFVGYEGLDDLAKACGILRQNGKEFRLLLVGNENASGNDRGNITEAIADCARAEGYLDWLVMPGRVPHELVPHYYSLIDITPFPRKPLPVCEMVSPIKPLEALAMEKAVLVSDVRALAEMVQDGKTGLLFSKGDVNDLAHKLTRLLGDAPLRKKLGRNGRLWVQEERSWSAAAQRMQSVLHARNR